MSELLKNLVKEQRQNHGFTQESLADQCNVSRQTIISIERGVYQPSVGLALKIAKVLKTNVESLFIIKN